MDTPLLDESWAEDDAKDEGPAWLNEENDARYSAAHGISEPNRGKDTAASHPHGDVTWAEDNVAEGAGSSLAAGGDSERRMTLSEDFPKIVLGMKIANIGAAVMLMAASISRIIDDLLTLAQWVVSAYATFFGLLLLLPEAPFLLLRSFAARSFGFLHTPLLRLLFLSLASSVAWSYHTPLGKVACVFLAFSAVLGTCILCCYPAFSEERDQIVAEEYRRAEAAEREIDRQRTREMAAKWRNGSDGL
uniref:Uncharacterized protein n=1 Tax=Trieres chinensis TaxID=1514140 RepID=A0A6U1XV74_TRICV|eukprot:CAMPEP_0183302778 /NCGR_PEP_ID=MMETSP0160_2-20130417/8438_1 /TAXON_ID=2839 ORGANISM="Odontella Sinensis, Strain Grunow 1884" /NCGR_SAMPLE_ID=MMETSP0160_2 /ASSEMBLY_ACC=CAM_ASM_000250 /LENGTH=246 /DNA_ID=CAMNT_0025465589 /DNA_START=42 /DNA_END=782 /DNA_ORIENTATION=-